MVRTSLLRIAGRLLLICAHCNAASMRRLLMFRKTNVRNWTNRRHRRRVQLLLQNERAFTYATDAGRRIFRQPSIYGAFNSSRFNCRGELGALSRRRVGEPASIQLLLAFCIRILLYTLRRLLLLDDRSPCYRRRLVRGCAASIGKHRCVVRRVGTPFRSNPPATATPLFVDGYSA